MSLQRLLAFHRYKSRELRLNSINIDLVDYYKNNDVKFSKGIKVDLMDSENEKVINNLAKRIYKTRNAVIHSKADEKDRHQGQRGTVGSMVTVKF